MTQPDFAEPILAHPGITQSGFAESGLPQSKLTLTGLAESGLMQNRAGREQAHVILFQEHELVRVGAASGNHPEDVDTAGKMSCIEKDILLA